MAEKKIKNLLLNFCILFLLFLILFYSNAVLAANQPSANVTVKSNANNAKTINKQLKTENQNIDISKKQDTGEYKFKNLSYDSGQDKISDYTNNTVSKKIRVQVLDAKNEEVENVPVYFSFISTPSKAKGHSIDDTIIITGKNGAAVTEVKTGDKPGMYNILVTSPMLPEKSLIIKVEAKKPSWGFDLTFGLLGGLALFLYGMKIMGDSLIKIGGSKMSQIINVLTSNRIMGVLVGTFVTMVV